MIARCDVDWCIRLMRPGLVDRVTAGLKVLAQGRVRVHTVRFLVRLTGRWLMLAMLLQPCCFRSAQTASDLKLLRY